MNWVLMLPSYDIIQRCHLRMFLQVIMSWSRWQTPMQQIAILYQWFSMNLNMCEWQYYAQIIISFQILVYIDLTTIKPFTQYGCLVTDVRKMFTPAALIDFHVFWWMTSKNILSLCDYYEVRSVEFNSSPCLGLWNSFQ